MRRTKPAPPTRPGYPRFDRAWRILLAAPIALLPSLALSDATVPKTGDKTGDKSGGKPEPQPTRPPDQPYPPMGGAPPMIEPPHKPPEPPQPPQKKEKAKPKKVGMVLHPHGPDEPCLPLDGGCYRVKA